MAKTPREVVDELGAIRADLAKRDFGLFVQASWEILEPNTPLKWNWHHDYLAEHLQATATGEITRLIINIAPRTMKSILSTVAFPPWVWTNRPSERFLFGSFSANLATQHSVLRRNIIDSQWYRKHYGRGFKLSEDVNTKAAFSNDKTGEMKAFGINSPPTGQGGDFITIDDPHDPQGSESQAERETTLMNWDLGWSTRLNDPKTGRIIIIMQRLHERDLTGHVMAKNLGYTHVKIPTVAEERERRVYPVSGKVKEREQGDFMHPDRFGHKESETAKIDLGPYGYSGQHQQSPTPRSGGIFIDQMFDFQPPPDQLDWRFITADTAYNDKKENDFTVFTAFGVANKELYILDVWRRQIKSSEVEAQILPFIQRFSDYGFRGCYIEPKGHGIYLNQNLPSKGVMIPSEDDRKEFFSDRRKDKVERANNAVPWLANRRVHINPTIPEKETLLAELLGFPKAAHDDFVDTVIDGIKKAFSRPPTMFDLL